MPLPIWQVLYHRSHQGSDGINTVKIFAMISSVLFGGIEPHLSLFDGFAELEAKKKTTMGYCYPSARVAFDAAVAALKELI